MRPDYSKINAETAALETVASFGSQLVIGAAILFVLVHTGLL